MSFLWARRRGDDDWPLQVVFAQHFEDGWPAEQLHCDHAGYRIAWQPEEGHAAFIEAPEGERLARLDAHAPHVDRAALHEYLLHDIVVAHRHACRGHQQVGLESQGLVQLGDQAFAIIAGHPQVERLRSP